MSLQVYKQAPGVTGTIFLTSAVFIASLELWKWVLRYHKSDGVDWFLVWYQGSIDPHPHPLFWLFLLNKRFKQPMMIL